MTIETATTPVAVEALCPVRAEVAPRAMLAASTSMFTMLRGPMVSYAPEDDGGTVAGAEAAPDAADTSAPEGEGQDDTDPDRMAAPDDGEEGDPAAPDAEGQAADDSEEVDYEGQKYKVPKVLKDALLRHADYTQKTQALAEARKALETEAQTTRLEAAAEAQTLLTEVQEEVAKVHTLKGHLAAYEAFDWSKAMAEAKASADPNAAVLAVNEAWMDYQQTKVAAEDAAKALEAKKTELRTQSEQGVATRMAEVGQTLARDIPGWSQETAGKLVELGKEYGFGLEDFSVMDDPRAWKAFHALHGARAEIADLKAQLAQKSKAANHVAAQTTTPAKDVKGKSPAPAKLDDRTGTDAWIARRNAEIAAKRRA